MRASLRGGVARIEVRRTLGERSTITQTYELGAWCDTLFIRTRLEWREERTLLRALFPTRIRTRSALFGTQLGHLARDAHRNTSWQQAQFEVPGHDWMSLSDGATSIAIIDDGIFGRSAVDGELGLSLVKSPNFPDPKADRGVHEFTYGVRIGDATEANAWAAAERLNRAVEVVASSRTTRATRAASATSAVSASNARTLQLVSIASSLDRDSVEVLAIKPADDASGDAILRVVDRSGAPQQLLMHWREDVRDAVACDLFERPLRKARSAVKGGTSVASLGAFEVASWRVRIRSHR